MRALASQYACDGVYRSGLPRERQSASEHAGSRVDFTRWCEGVREPRETRPAEDEEGERSDEAIAARGSEKQGAPRGERKGGRKGERFHPVGGCERGKAEGPRENEVELAVSREKEREGKKRRYRRRSSRKHAPGKLAHRCLPDSHHANFRKNQ